MTGVQVLAGGLMTVYASNITIRISPRHGAVLAGVLSGFPQRREGGDICVHVPDMYLQEHKDLLVDFRLPARSDGICVSDDVDSSDRTGCGCFQTRGPQVKPGNGVQLSCYALVKCLIPYIDICPVLNTAWLHLLHCACPGVKCQGYERYRYASADWIELRTCALNAGRAAWTQSGSLRPHACFPYPSSSSDSFVVDAAS